MSGEPSVLTWLPVLGGLALKSLILFLIAGAALLAGRRASASARHLVCLLTLAALLALPVLSLALPGWRLAVLSAPQGGEPTPRQVAAPPETGGEGVSDAGKAASNKAGAASSAPTPLVLTSSSRFGRTPASGANKEVGSPWPLLLAALWLAGALLAALRPLLGLWGIARLSRTSAAVLDAPTLALTAECASALGLAAPPIMRQADAPVPMTWGWRHPVVLLPAEASTWSSDLLRAVLLHELAHVRRHDWLSHRLADVVCALYWFHPLAWLTARRLKMEGEIACDDLVLTSGVPAPDYARHLLDVARALRPALVPTAAIAMARTARIEGRLTMILDTTRPRRALTRRFLLTALGVGAAALVPLAALRPGVRAQAGTPAASRRHLTPMDMTPATPAVFPGSIPIQLVGVGSPKTLKWWGKNGVPLAQPVYGISPALSLGELPDPRQRQVQLAFRLPPSAQDVTVKYALTGSLNSSSDGSWPFKTQDQKQWREAQLNERTGGARIVTATYPASVTKTNVRVGIAFGPWKTAATDTRDTLSETAGYMSAGTRDSGIHKFIFGQPIDVSSVETKSNVVLTISTDTTDDLRVVAVTTQGQTVLPYQVGGNSIGTLDQITARFAGLPLSQIKEIRVETRPFRYVEFKNVALRPAK